MNLSDYEYYRTDKGVLYCGDCLSILPLIKDKVDLVLTDPPYGINYDIQQNEMAGHRHGRGEWTKYDDTNWDNEVDIKIWQELFKHGKVKIIWGGNYYFLPSKCRWLVWNKIQRGFMSDGEMAWTNMKGNLNIFDMSRVEAYTHKNKKHPTQKPIELILWCINISKTKGIILDPFLGSGTTAVACEKLNRKWIGIEINKGYAEIAKQRIKAEADQIKMELK